MKKVIKSIIVMLAIFIVALINVNSSYAADSTNFSVILTASSTDVQQGATVDVYIAIGQFSNIGEGVNAFMGKLEYDSNKLTLDSNNIVAQNSWDAPSYENEKLLTLKGSMIKAQENIIKLTFKVKESAATGATTIKITNAEAANTTTDFVGKDGSVTITIVKKSEQPSSGNEENDSGNNGQTVNQGETGNSNGQQTGGEQQKGDNEQTPGKQITVQAGSEGTTTKDESTSQEDLPKTGTSYMIVAIMAGIIVIAIIVHKKYRKIVIK